MVSDDINKTMGVILIATIFDAVLLGLVIFQVYRYFQIQRDRFSLRFLVTLLCVLDTFQLILIVHALYHFVILNFNNSGALEVSVWSLNIEVGLTVVITFIVRCFFTVRLWHLSHRNKWLALAISLLSLTQLGLGLAMTAICFVIMRFDALPRFMAPLCVQLGCAVLADICITAPLVFYLNQSRTSFRSTNNLINRLILWSVNTALITGIFESLVLITWVTMPSNLYFVAIHLVVGKLYTNSLLAMLNARQQLAQDDYHTSAFVVSTTQPQFLTEISARAPFSTGVSAAQGAPGSSTAARTQESDMHGITWPPEYERRSRETRAESDAEKT